MSAAQNEVDVGEIAPSQAASAPVPLTFEALVEHGASQRASGSTVVPKKRKTEPQPPKKLDPLGEKIVKVADTIVDRPPFVSGKFVLPAQSSVLFFGKDDVNGRVDFSNVKEVDLEALTKACQPATFGRNAEDVLDESYRKAGKLDATNFAINLSLPDTGALELITDELLEAREGDRHIKTELYKLNVYGKDSFFKAHKDTPRGETMFGSLVMVFPTPHEGGGLILRHEGKEWTFDSARIISGQAQPSAAYIAFFSDIEHEVLPVTSGHRVTITYNLYFANSSVASVDTAAGRLSSTRDESLKNAMLALLEDPQLLPKGGCLGFGLKHQYPTSEGKAVGHLIHSLKGSDNLVAKTCRELGLSTFVVVLYKIRTPFSWCSETGTDFLFSRVPDFTGYRLDADDIESYVRRKPFRGTPVQSRTRKDAFALSKSDNGSIDVWWVTDVANNNGQIKSMYTAYGNEPLSGVFYGNCCLIVRVGKPGQRLTRAEDEQTKAKLKKPEGDQPFSST